MSKLNLFIFKFKKSYSAVIKFFLRNPLYVLVAAGWSSLALTLVVWLFNLELLWFLITNNNLGFSGKIDVIWGISTFYLGSTGTASGLGIGVVIFSILFGINTALLIYVLKNKVQSRAASGKTATGMLFAVVGGGCVACGTSLLAPIIAATGAAGAVFLRDLSVFIYWIASTLIGYSIYGLGKAILEINTTKKQ